MEVTPPEGTRGPFPPPTFLHVPFRLEQGSLRPQEQDLGRCEVASAGDARPAAPCHHGAAGMGRRAGSADGKEIDVGEASSGKNRYLAH